MISSYEDEFYLTLLSDASLNFYPENRHNFFTVQLPRTIHLSEDFRVAATSITFPQTVQNMTADNNRLILEMDKYDPKDPDEVFKLRVTINVPHDNYANIYEVIKGLNVAAAEKFMNIKGEQLGDLFKINEATQRIEIDSLQRDLLCKKSKIQYDGTKSQCHMTRLYLEGRLALMCGFDPDKHNLLNKNETIGRYPYNLNLGFPNQLFIHTDIIESQIIGDKKTQVLKICPILDKMASFGDVTERTFHNCDFLKLAKRSFDKITIQIKDNKDALLPFLFGSLTVQLLFKKFPKNDSL
jgi:hypothetical protein